MRDRAFGTYIRATCQVEMYWCEDFLKSLIFWAFELVDFDALEHFRASAMWPGDDNPKDPSHHPRPISVTRATAQASAKKRTCE